MITIVTDSTSYFKKQEAEELGIRVISNNYNVNGQSYCESFSDQNGDFESLLIGAEETTTSHMNLAECVSCFEEELAKGNQVLCITISSRLSGAYSTANVAAEQTESSDVSVFDSQFTAGGLYLLIKEARSMIDKGMSLQEILAELPDVRGRTNIAFSVDDMTPLRRSGRIGFVRMSVGTILNIKPILMCKDGAVVSDCVAHGDREVIKKLSDKISEDARKVVISYIGSNKLAGDLYHVIKQANPDAEVSLQKVGPVLSIHLGLKTIAVSFI
jgi:DegV family protein with EDD domain